MNKQAKLRIARQNPEYRKRLIAKLQKTSSEMLPVDFRMENFIRGSGTTSNVVVLGTLKIEGLSFPFNFSVFPILGNMGAIVDWKGNLQNEKSDMNRLALLIFKKHYKSELTKKVLSNKKLKSIIFTGW